MSFDEFSLQLTVQRTGGGVFNVNVYAIGTHRTDYITLSDGTMMYPHRPDAAEQLSGGASLDEKAMLAIAYQLAAEAVATLVKRHAAGMEQLREAAAKREAEIAVEAEQLKKQNSHLV